MDEAEHSHKMFHKILNDTNHVLPTVASLPDQLGELSLRKRSHDRLLSYNSTQLLAIVILLPVNSFKAVTSCNDLFYFTVFFTVFLYENASCQSQINEYRMLCYMCMCICVLYLGYIVFILANCIYKQ